MRRSSGWGQDDALQAALTGGEDYELCFVTDPDIVDRAHFLERVRGHRDACRVGL